MDPSRPPTAYRAGIVRCPGCGEVMRAEPVVFSRGAGGQPAPGSEVDACDSCGGLWVDWFDGELQSLAVEAEAARVERGTPPPPLRSSKAAAHDSTCPGCRRALVQELFRFSDAIDDELVPGVEVLRCPECVGSFIPRSSAHLLLDRVREPRKLTLWEVLVLLLERLGLRR